MTHVRQPHLSLKALVAPALFTLIAAVPALAQISAPAPRITTPIVDANRVTLPGSKPPLATPANDLGVVPSTTKLTGISLVFSRTDAQQAVLDALVAAQQNPASPLYHQWLTPDQFAARFGVADSDIAAAESWLQHQGFAIDSVSRSRNRIVFSGNAGLVASAFGAPLHYFKLSTATRATETPFAPASDLTIPAALASSVLAINNLSTFRLRPRIRFRGVQGSRPAFTSSTSGNHFITPGDLATIYDVTPAYSAGYTGSNQSIAVVGQSDVVLSDISNFQTAVNIIAKAPQFVLVPSTGASTIYTGDEAESDLDLEYSSTMASGAQVFFVYTGNSSTTSGVFDSIAYAVDERIAPIITSSYGACEPVIGTSNYASLNQVLEQGAAQGQTILSASGDSGSTDCYGEYDAADVADNEQLAVDFPGSSQYVTSMGGTEFPAADVAAGDNDYFSPQTTTDTISSALSYIPEEAWNDDPTFSADPSDPLGAGGGGASIFTARPAWQAGTIGGNGIPSGIYRLVPDISLTASPVDAPLAYCTSDTTAWSTGQVASCNDGLRDSSTGALTVAGGTSFVAPTFAGMLAVIEQRLNSTGEGVINSTLYTLATTPATYSTAFHDVTSGGNQCTAGTAFCSTAGKANYATAIGYDEATGLGSIDLFNLLTAWPKAAAASLVETAVTLAPDTTTPASGAADTITITVGEINLLDPAIMNPTGTVALTIDGVAPTAATTLTLTAGTVTYTYTPTASGAHVIVATYAGDTLNASSEATLVVTVGGSGVGAFTVAAGNISVATGSAGTSTITVTPSGGYSGTVAFTVGIASVSTGADADLTDSCYTINNGTDELAVTGTAAVTTTLTIYTSITSCETADASGVAKRRFVHRAPQHASNTRPRPEPPSSAPIATALAGLLALGLLRKRFRRMPPLLSMFVLALCLGVAGLGLSGCSNNSSTTGGGGTTPTGDETPGTYNLTLTGTDTASGTQTATSNFTLTITQ